MFKLRSQSIARQLGLVIASALAGIFVLAAVFLFTERDIILEERKNAVRQNVEIAHGLLTHFQEQASQGKLSEDEAKQRALAAIKGLRYSGSEYFWINDMHPRMVMHAIKAELDGKDLSENKDPTGKRLFMEFVNTVKASGAGFVFYMWPKPGSDQPVQKLSYVKGFAPWGWVVGSGVYIDTVNATVMQRVIGMSAGSVLLAALLLLIGLAVSRNLLRQLGGEPAYAANITQHIAAGDLSVDIALKAKTAAACCMRSSPCATASPAS